MWLVQHSAVGSTVWTIFFTVCRLVVGSGISMLHFASRAPLAICASGVLWGAWICGAWVYTKIRGSHKTEHAESSKDMQDSVPQVSMSSFRLILVDPQVCAVRAFVSVSGALWAL